MASADTAQGRKSRACFRTFSGDSSSREPRLFLPPKTNACLELPLVMCAGVLPRMALKVKAWEGTSLCSSWNRMWRQNDKVPMTKQHRLIRTDGTERILDKRPSFEEIRRLIGCDGLDTVTIDRRRQTVMFVDDTGMIDGKPVNAKATALYHAICKAD